MKKIKITAYVEKKVWEKSIQPLNQLRGIRRDELLNLWLDAALDLLKDKPCNSLSKEIYRLYVEKHTPIDKKKINLTINKETLIRLDSLLNEKNVPKGLFLSVFLNSLDILIRDLKYTLDDPFHEYIHGMEMSEFRFLNLFPNKQQSENAKQKYNELITFLSGLNSDDF